MDHLAGDACRSVLEVDIVSGEPPPSAYAMLLRLASYGNMYAWFICRVTEQDL